MNSLLVIGYNLLQSTTIVMTVAPADAFHSVKRIALRVVLLELVDETY